MNLPSLIKAVREFLALLKGVPVEKRPDLQSRLKDILTRRPGAKTMDEDQVKDLAQLLVDVKAAHE